jgi:hypothetical protein
MRSVRGVAIACILGAGGCSSTTETDEGIAVYTGRFMLGTVNGQTLPALIPRDPTMSAWQRFIESSELVTRLDQTFTNTRILQIRTTGTPFTQEQVWTGTWRTLDGSKIELRYDASHAGKVDTADVFDALLTYREPGAIYLYAR